MNRALAAVAALSIIAIAIVATSLAILSDTQSTPNANNQQTPNPTQVIEDNAQPTPTQQSTATQETQPNPTQGTITSTENIDIYTDPQATNVCTQIDWRTLTEGTTSTHVLYLKNSGTTNKTLHLTTTDWTPTATASLMALGWDKENTTLAPGSVIAATLTLSAAQDMADVDSFSFNIVIEGT
jgi:hypothetical protein